MATVHDIDESHLLSWLYARPQIAAAWLFGSVARGEAGPGSDLDLAVLLREEGGAEVTGLRQRLLWIVEVARLLGLPSGRIDLVILNQAPPLLVHAVLKEGRRLVDKAPAARIRFEERALHRYVIAARLRDESMRERARRFGVELRR